MPGSEGWPAAAWEAFEEFRGQVERKFNVRVGRGDVRAAVIRLLAETPMHGYQIIHEITERSGGAWKPSPGSVYPTLQLLVDEGLVTAVEADGRKTYSLTEAGTAAAAADSEKPAPWDVSIDKPAMPQSGIAKAGFELAGAAAQVARKGTPEQIERAVELLEETRNSLLSILTQD